jgi:type I restriction enzyme S subunit
VKWRTTQLKYVTTLVAGGTPSIDEPRYWSDDPDHGVPWVTIGDMTRSPRVHKTVRRVSFEGLSSRRLQVGKPETILFAMYASVGALAVLDRPAAWNQAILGIRARAGISESRFVRYWLESLRPSLAELFRSNTQDNLNAEQVASLPFPGAPVEEQREIADFLDAETARIDALIVKKRAVMELLAERFESAIFASVTRGLRREATKPSGLSWVERIPESWGTPAVSVNFQLQLGKMLNAEAAQGLDQYPYVRNVNVQWDRIHLDDLATMHFSEEDRHRYELRPGDVLVCEGGDVGRAAIWSDDQAPCYFQKAIHRVRPRSRANSRYLMYCLRAAANRSVFAVEGNLSTIAHLTGEQLRVHRFPWPPADEQSEIVSYLDLLRDATDAARRSLQRQIALLHERRQAVITAAVTGQLDLPGLAA